MYSLQSIQKNTSDIRSSQARTKDGNDPILKIGEIMKQAMEASKSPIVEKERNGNLCKETVCIHRHKATIIEGQVKTEEASFGVKINW